ncbi:hypothetical protein HKX48_001999, partial [Thoreauomyces humboldtii]
NIARHASGTIPPKKMGTYANSSTGLGNVGDMTKRVSGNPIATLDYCNMRCSLEPPEILLAATEDGSGDLSSAPSTVETVDLPQPTGTRTSSFLIRRSQLRFLLHLARSLDRHSTDQLIATMADNTTETLPPVPPFDTAAFVQDVLDFFPRLTADPVKAFQEFPHVPLALVGLIVGPTLLYAILKSLFGGKKVVNALHGWTPKSLTEEADELEKDAFTAPATEIPWEVGISAAAIAVSENGQLRVFETLPETGKVTAEQITAAVVKAIAAPLEGHTVQRPKLVSFLQSRQCSEKVYAQAAESIAKFGIRVGTAEELEPELSEYVVKRREEVNRLLATALQPAPPQQPAPGGPKPPLSPAPNRGCFVCKKDIAGKASQCSACKAMIYCSTDCSKKDWPTHKAVCKGFKANMDRIENENLHDLPFDFYNEQKQLHSFNQVAFLVQKDVHNIGIFRRLCACYNQIAYGELAAGHIAQMQAGNITDPRERFKLFGLSDVLFPLSAAYPEGTDVRTIDSWKKYYELRNIPMDDPAALVLEVPLTVWHMVNKYVLDGIVNKPDGRREITIHIAGVEKEADLCALFEILLSLLPKSDIAVHMISPAISPRLPPQQATLGIRNEAMDSTILVTLRPGLYSPQHLSGDQYKSEGLPFGTGKPDVVVVMNSALLAQQTWAPTLKLLMDAKQKTLFTDQMEHTVEMIAKQLDVVGCKLSVGPVINPFRQPVLQWKKDTNLPGWSNGFLFGIY